MTDSRGDTRNRVLDVCGSLEFLRVMQIRLESRLTSHAEVPLPLTALQTPSSSSPELLLEDIMTEKGIERERNCLTKYPCCCLTIINDPSEMNKYLHGSYKTNRVNPSDSSLSNRNWSLKFVGCKNCKFLNVNWFVYSNRKIFTYIYSPIKFQFPIQTILSSLESICRNRSS